MRTSLRAALTTAAAAFSLVVGTQAPAHAATGYDRCLTGRFCIFDGADGQGAMASYTTSQPTLGSWAAKASSVYNRTGYEDFCLYSRDNYQYTDPAHDIQVTLDASSNRMNLAYTTVDGRLDNNLRSFRWAHTGRECVGQPEPLLWSAPYGIPAGGTAQSFGDLDGDGTSDLLNRTYSGRLWFLRGDEKGRLVGTGWNSMSMLTRHGDLNSDGTEDLLARDPAGKLWLYPGNGKGGFTSRTFVGGGWNAMTRIQAVGDLNGDGKGDLVSRDTSGRLWLYPGNGRGGFTSRAFVGGGWNAMRAFAGPGDFNGDGHTDLAVSDSSGKLWLYPGNGRGGFTARALIGSGGWTPFTTLLGIGNIPSTPYPDLLAAQSVASDGGGGEVRLYNGVGGGRLGSGSIQAYLDHGDALF